MEFSRKVAKGVGPVVLALILSSFVALQASANSYNSGTQEIQLTNRNDSTLSFSTPVTAGLSSNRTIQWQCVSQWNSTLSATITIAVGGPVSDGGSGGPAQTPGDNWVNASVTWSGQTIPVAYVGYMSMPNDPVQWQFTVEDQTFIDGYDPGDFIELSATINDNQVLLYGAPSGGGQLNSGANYFNYRPATFSGINVTSGTNGTSTSGCVQQAPNNPPPTPPLQGQDSGPTVKYSGPEFSGLSARGFMAGSSPRLEGKNLDEISSIQIGGKAATFTLDGDKALDLTLPESLAPGLYDLVINSSAGKLTHINAIQVREPRRAISVTTRSEGRISEDQYREHTIISAMQIPELNKARCIVNGSNLAQAKAQAERLCALVAAANPNIETTVVEPRSTVKKNTVFARVTYGWN